VFIPAYLCACRVYVCVESDVLRGVLDHAYGDSLHESIGFLGGRILPIHPPKGDSDTMFHITHFSAMTREVGTLMRDSVEASAVDQFRVKEQFETLGLEFLGWYHTHPSIHPFPSMVDIAMQKQFQDHWSPLCIGLICSPYMERAPRKTDTERMATYYNMFRVALKEASSHDGGAQSRSKSGSRRKTTREGDEIDDVEIPEDMVEDASQVVPCRVPFAVLSSLPPRPSILRAQVETHATAVREFWTIYESIKDRDQTSLRASTCCTSFLSREIEVGLPSLRRTLHADIASIADDVRCEEEKLAQEIELASQALRVPKEDLEKDLASRMGEIDETESTENDIPIKQDRVLFTCNTDFEF
jgi:proteasome lid subunit RPN8/RPN11